MKGLRTNAGSGVLSRVLRFWIFLLFGFSGTGAALAECRSDQVVLRGDWGQVSFSVEIAETDETRAQGLMFRESMVRGAGMLFVYDRPQHAYFWMKNTLIPLDMIFVNRDGLVTRVHSDAVPGDLTAIDGGPGVYAVLEINGGLAADYGIDAGSQMQHPAFDGDALAWPCE